jgi:hypothetical protein
VARRLQALDAGIPRRQMVAAKLAFWAASLANSATRQCTSVR